MGEEDNDDIPPILVMWDSRSGMMLSLLVDEKGPVGYVVKWCVEKFERAGYGGIAITLKSDGEASNVSLKRCIDSRRTAETMPIETPVRESKSNGAIERGVRTWQGQFRTLKNKLESHLKNKVEMRHPLTGWLVMWAAEFVEQCLKFACFACLGLTCRAMPSHGSRLKSCMLQNIPNLPNLPLTIIRAW